MMPTKARAMTANRCTPSCSSSILTHTHTETSVKVINTENESEIQDETDFQREDLMADNNDH